jgi:hypothetical protein
VRGHARQRTGGWLIAIAPGAFAFLFEGLVLIAARKTNSTTPASIGIYVFIAALVAAVLAPFAIGLSRQRDAFTWAVVSLGASFFGLGIGFYFWLLAAITNCGRPCWN